MHRGAAPRPPRSLGFGSYSCPAGPIGGMFLAAEALHAWPLDFALPHQLDEDDYVGPSNFNPIPKCTAPRLQI